MGYLHARFDDGTERVYGDAPYTRAFTRAEMRAIDSPAMQRAFAAIDARVRTTAVHLIKAQARRYKKFPGFLEMIAPGLSYATASAMITFGLKRLQGHRAIPISRTDLMVPVKAANLRAVVLIGRYLRRFEQRLAA